MLDNKSRELKDVSNALVDERRRLEELQAKQREKEELLQKISNLQRSAAELRESLPLDSGEQAMISVAIGEADKGLDFDGQLAKLKALFQHPDMGPHIPFTQEQVAVLSTLERVDVLSGRVKAYMDHNETLEWKSKELKGKSAELEERYKKIVSLCTKVEPENVDNVLDSLLQAVVSEQKENVELGRVRQFLRMVHGDDG